jgi:hypothetical protein
MKKRHCYKSSLNTIDYVLELLSLLSVLCTIVLFVIFWIEAPKSIPIHYNIYGIADRFGNKTTLIILPVMSVVTYAGLTFLNKFPYIFNFPVKVTEQNRLILYKNTTKMVRWNKLIICLLFAVIVWQQIGIIRNHYNKLNNISIFILIAYLILCFIFFAIKMNKVNRNLD